MRKYWIIIDGKPMGPLTPAEIAAMPEFAPSLPAWHSGLEQWLTVERIPELAALLPASEAEGSSMPRADRAVVEEVVVESAATGRGAAPLSWGAPSGRVPRMEAADAVERPSSYLVWNIIATVCCCLPAGVVGIIFSSKVNAAWLSGDVDAAKAASEKAAWCFIISFTLGLMLWPFQLMFTGA